MGKKRIKEKTEEEVFGEKEKMEAALKKTAVKLAQKKLFKGKACIQASYNNTIITLTDLNGNVLAWSSSGSLGFKGAKRATPFAASKVAEAVVEKIKKTGLEEVAVIVKGIGSGRESAIRSLANRGLNIVSIKDVTPMPHNGCRPPKARRV